MRIIYLILISLSLTLSSLAQKEPAIKVGAKFADLCNTYICNETQTPIIKPSVIIGKSYALKIGGIDYYIVVEKATNNIHTIRTYDPKFQTSNGLRIGSSKSDIVAVYPKEFPYWGFTSMFIRSEQYQFNFADRDHDSVTSIDMQQIPMPPVKQQVISIITGP